MPKVIIMDVDGVVADFTGGLMEHNPERKRLGAEAITGYRMDFTPAEVKACEDHNFWRNLSRYPDANPKALEDAGHTLVWCTKPWESCVGWAYARTAWLKKHFNAQEIICTAAKHRVKGDVLIEDSFENLIAWKKHFPEGRALLYTRPWNASFEYQDRFTWDMLPQLLEELEG
jgi:5'(3')-deoxyribonucleotidase